MSRMIDADLLLADVGVSMNNNPHKGIHDQAIYFCEHSKFVSMIKGQPTVNSVPVVVEDIEKKLIDANDLIGTLAIVARKFAKTEEQQELMARIFYIIDHKPEAVVRCKNCRHRDRCNLMTDDDFCSDGEMKEHGTDE